jgi:hypothetical protein
VPAIRALAVVITAWVLVTLAPPGPAYAGGPTSALLSVPGQGRTASLYYSDAAYEELADLVGAFDGTGTRSSSQPSHESGTTVTVTWLIHDVEPWRVDRIYLGGDDGPWIATQQMLGDDTSIWDSPVSWHQPSDGTALVRLLDSLGVGRTGTAAEAASPAEPGDNAPASVEPAATAPAPSDGTSGTSARDHAWWGLGGLAGGVLLAVGWTRVRTARRRSRDDGWDPDAEHLGADSRREWLSVGR